LKKIIDKKTTHRCIGMALGALKGGASWGICPPDFSKICFKLNVLK